MLYSRDEITVYDDTRNCCICVLDMLNNSNKKNMMKNNNQLRKYYSKFINSLYVIAKKFNIKVVTNKDNSIFLYSKTISNLGNIKPFEIFFTCIYSILEERDKVNKNLLKSNLPLFIYQVSIDYGNIDLSMTEKFDQLGTFCTNVIVCSNSNSSFVQNEVRIEDKLYKILESLLFDSCYEYQLKINYNNVN